MNSHEVFIHIHQGCFAGTGAIVRLPQCQWSKPGGYGKISECITTTKHSKAKTVCIFLGIYCTPLQISACQADTYTTDGRNCVGCPPHSHTQGLGTGPESCFYVFIVHHEAHFWRYLQCRVSHLCTKKNIFLSSSRIHSYKQVSVYKHKCKDSGKHNVGYQRQLKFTTIVHTITIRINGVMYWCFQI